MEYHMQIHANFKGEVPQVVGEGRSSESEIQLRSLQLKTIIMHAFIYFWKSNSMGIFEWHVSQK